MDKKKGASFCEGLPGNLTFSNSIKQNNPISQNLPCL
jgi:hypothetical protein